MRQIRKNFNFFLNTLISNDANPLHSESFHRAEKQKDSAITQTNQKKAQTKWIRRQETCGLETQTHFQTAARTATFVAHPDSYSFLFFTCNKPRLVQTATGERFTMHMDFLVANTT